VTGGSKRSFRAHRKKNAAPEGAAQGISKKDAAFYAGAPPMSPSNLITRINELELAYDRLARRLAALEGDAPAVHPKRGRPFGSKNRPKGNDVTAAEPRV
jgi:hypothetical protein